MAQRRFDGLASTTSDLDDGVKDTPPLAYRGLFDHIQRDPEVALRMDRIEREAGLL